MDSLQNNKRTQSFYDCRYAFGQVVYHINKRPSKMTLDLSPVCFQGNLIL